MLMVKPRRFDMVIDRQQKYRQMAAQGKYQRLYTHLCSLAAKEWKTSFSEIESIMGFELPPSARLHRPWWANQSGGNGHSQALAWTAAGWETTEVDMDSETLLLRRRPVESSRKLTLDELWPVHRVGAWPAGLSLRREDLYEERV